VSGAADHAVIASGPERSEGRVAIPSWTQPDLVLFLAVTAANTRCAGTRPDYTAGNSAVWAQTLRSIPRSLFIRSYQALSSRAPQPIQSSSEKLCR
jgi:hypothetical protein